MNADMATKAIAAIDISGEISHTDKFPANGNDRIIGKTSASEKVNVLTIDRPPINNRFLSIWPLFL
jgi:hypothetical protein